MSLTDIRLVLRGSKRLHCAAFFLAVINSLIAKCKNETIHLYRALHMNYRIALLCVSGERPTYSLATASDNSLHIISVKNIPNDIFGMKEFLDGEADFLSEKSVTLYVDDPSGLLKDYGYSCSLASKEYDNESVLKRSLDRFLTLQRAGAISLPSNAHGFEIPPSIINERIKDTGESYYVIDWPQLSDNARAALLLTHCGFSQDLHKTSFVKSMFAALSVIEEDDEDETTRFISTILERPETPVRSGIQELRNRGRRIL